MATKLQFQEYEDALVVRVVTQPRALSAALSALVAGGFTGIVISVYTGASAFVRTPGFLLAIAVATAVGFIKGKLPSRSELRVTNLEYQSRSFGAWGFEQAKTIPRMDVRWLEHHDDSSGPEGGDPGGLHAVLKHRSFCILRDVNAEQSAEVVDRITRKFPSFREQWSTESAFGDGFITLDLDHPESRS
jgi:hypothetical protein